MASRSSKTNGRPNGRPAGFDPRRVTAQTEQVTTAANAIARLTDDVSDGAEAQIRSLDGALSGLNQMAASLKETAGQAESLSASAETDLIEPVISSIAAAVSFTDEDSVSVSRLTDLIELAI